MGRASVPLGGCFHWFDKLQFVKFKDFQRFASSHDIPWKAIHTVGKAKNEPGKTMPGSLVLVGEQGFDGLLVGFAAGGHGQLVADQDHLRPFVFGQKGHELRPNLVCRQVGFGCADQ